MLQRNCRRQPSCLHILYIPIPPALPPQRKVSPHTPPIANGKRKSRPPVSNHTQTKQSATSTRKHSQCKRQRHHKRQILRPYGTHPDPSRTGSPPNQSNQASQDQKPTRRRSVIASDPLNLKHSLPCTPEQECHCPNEHPMRSNHVSPVQSKSSLHSTRHPIPLPQPAVTTLPPSTPSTTSYSPSAAPASLTPKRKSEVINSHHTTRPCPSSPSYNST